MPDPSGEPSSPSHEPPGHPRPSGPADGPSHLAPAPRLHPSPVQQHAKPVSKVPPPPPGSRAVLEWLREYGNLDVDPDEPLPPASGDDHRAMQSRLPKEQRKFHKFDPAHPQPSSVSVAGASRAGAASGGLPEADASLDDLPRGITAEQLAYIRQARAGASERRLWFALAVAVIAFLAVTAAFVAAHWPSSARPVADSSGQAAATRTNAGSTETVPSLSPDTINLLDQAAAAEAAADYARAIQLFEQARQGTGHIHGLNFHLASLCYKANEMAQVLPLLNASIAEGEEVAACYSLRGTLLNQTEGTPSEPSDLEKATRLEPLDARFFFAWAEALRRAGKPELALPQLRRAVERVQEPALSAVYSLKLRLTQIELEQGDALNVELAEKLRENPPPSEWLLTSAALDLQRGDYAAAAQALDKMRAQVGDRELLRQLKDVFFKRFTREPEVARFFDAPVAP